MESRKIYEDSGDELAKIRKSLGSDSTTINWSKLDGETKNELNLAVTDVIIKRQKEIEKITLGVQWLLWNWLILLEAILLEL